MEIFIVFKYNASYKRYKRKRTYKELYKIRTHRIHRLKSIANVWVVTSYKEKFKNFKRECQVI